MSRAHATLVLLALVATFWVPNALVLVAAYALAFATLLWCGRGAYSAHAGFGAANWVTLFRLCLTLAAAVLPGYAVGYALLVSLALDGVDGRVARAAHTSSAFGAHFDTEADAAYVLVASFELGAHGLAPKWVLVGGLLRYLYVLCLWLFPPSGGEAPRSLLGRLAFLVVALSFVLPWFIEGRGSRLVACLGAACSLASFARSFWYSYASREFALRDQ